MRKTRSIFVARILGCLFSLLLPSIIFINNTFAARFDQNPDRVPSIGISLGLGGAGGTGDVFASGLTASQDVSSGVFDISLDFRNPLSGGLTLFGGLSLISTFAEANETPLLAGQEVSTFGVIGRIGLRWYFNQ